MVVGGNAAHCRQEQQARLLDWCALIHGVTRSSPMENLRTACNAVGVWVEPAMYQNMQHSYAHSVDRDWFTTNHRHLSAQGGQVHNTPATVTCFTSFLIRNLSYSASNSSLSGNSLLAPTRVTRGTWTDRQTNRRIARM